MTDFLLIENIFFLSMYRYRIKTLESKARNWISSKHGVSEMVTDGPCWEEEDR